MDTSVNARRRRRAGLVLCWLLSVGVAAAQGQGKGRLAVEFDEELTPLQKAVKASVDDKKGKGKQFPQLSLKCANPSSNNPRCEALAEPCMDCGAIINPAGKVVGRKNRTETVIDYGAPGQRRSGADRFDRIKIGGRKADGFGAGPEQGWKGIQRPPDRPDLAGISDRDAAAAVGGRDGEQNPTRARLRRARSGLAEPVNNDRDCVDAVTRVWAQGEDCFDDDGALLVTLTELDDGIGCRHDATGEVFRQDPDDGLEDLCYADDGTFRGTSLEELIDEDGPEDLAGDPIDQDGDGAFDEDPSESGEVAAACAAFYVAEGLEFEPTLDLDGDQCDLSRAFMVRFNRMAEQMARDADEDVELPYLVDAQGLPVDGETAKQAKYRKAKGYGEHPRRVRISEDYAIKCKGNEELIDGECVGQAGGELAKFAYAKASPADKMDFDRSERSPMLMGFTFAPPVIEWGYTIDEEVCVNLLVGKVCAEVFFARIGYEFDVAAGLRLPVEIELRELPPEAAPGILAQSLPVIRTALEPKDFTVGDFKTICQDNGIADGRLISDCTRFAFPEFLDSFNPFKAADDKDGSELVAKETIFAGVQVRVLRVPVINWAVDSDVDLMAMCTMLHIKDAVEGATLADIARIGVDLAQGQTTALLEALKENNCASFTTPFGFDEDGELRTFPFTQGFDVRADCASALAAGEVINVKGSPRPICTGLVLGVHGASLGVGLGIEAALGSTLIDAEWQVAGDARRAAGAGGSTLRYRHRPGSEAEVLDIALEVDNFQGGERNDSAIVSLDDFTYYLNTIDLTLSATLQFGGILEPIPDIATFELFKLVLTGDTLGIPIGQHRGMDPIEAELFVRNHALSVDAEPAAGDPNRQNADTLLIKPGEAGAFEVRVNNLGSVVGAFDRFRFALSNRRGQSAPYSFLINPNTDLDCIDSAGNHFFGNPYDAIPDDCYTATGAVRADRSELIDEDGIGPDGALAELRDEDGDGLADEDPIDDWRAAFDGESIVGVGAYTRSTDRRLLSVTPFRHPLTTPGLYPVQVLADSREARNHALDAVDPVGQRRVDAEDVVFIKVDSFFEPQIAAAALVESGKPGIGKAYSVEVGNGGNVADTFTVATDRIDSNQGSCSLTARGGGQEACPYRAEFTALRFEWTGGDLPTPSGPLEPLAIVSNQYTVEVPSDWAGMEDTAYQVVFAATSTADPEMPAAANSVLVEQTVIATMESMTRYIGLEFEQLIATLDQANADGIATAGLKPITVQAAQRANDRALAAIVAGDLAKAARTHAANIRIMEGFVRALSGSGKDLPAALFADLNARAAAIIVDLTTAEASPIPSA